MITCFSTLVHCSSRIFPWRLSYQQTTSFYEFTLPILRRDSSCYSLASVFIILKTLSPNTQKKKCVSSEEVCYFIPLNQVRKDNKKLLCSVSLKMHS